MGAQNPAYRETVWNYTQQQLPIVAASTALYPSIYIESPLRDSGYSLATVGYRRGEMRSVVGQAVAAANSVGGRPVIPFMRTFCFFGTMACYDPSINKSLELSRWGVEAGLTVPYEEGGAGVVIYQEQEAVKDAAELAHQLTTVTGPLGKSFLERVRACGASRCSGHGRCMPLDGDAGCECDAGHAGPTCASRVL